jgi:hypothetical protein
MILRGSYIFMSCHLDVILGPTSMIRYFISVGKCNLSQTISKDESAIDMLYPIFHRTTVQERATSSDVIGKCFSGPTTPLILAHMLQVLHPSCTILIQIGQSLCMKLIHRIRPNTRCPSHTNSHVFGTSWLTRGCFPPSSPASHVRRHPDDDNINHGERAHSLRCWRCRDGSGDPDC